MLDYKQMTSWSHDLNFTTTKYVTGRLQNIFYKLTVQVVKSELE